MAFQKLTLSPYLNSPPSPLSSPFSKLKDLKVISGSCSPSPYYLNRLSVALTPVSPSCLFVCRHLCSPWLHSTPFRGIYWLPDLPLILSALPILALWPNNTSCFGGIPLLTAMVASHCQQLLICLPPLGSAGFSLSNVPFSTSADPSRWRHLEILPKRQIQFIKPS